MNVKIPKEDSIKDVDSYITEQAEEARPHLKELREIIISTIPQAKEEILWSYPFYRYQGILLAEISAYKKHVSFQVSDSLKNQDKKTLEEKGYVLGEKRIQIKFNQEIPTTTIRKILNDQARINESK